MKYTSSVDDPKLKAVGINKYTYIITIIMPCYDHGFLCLSLSLAIRLYHPSLPACPLDNIMCPHRAVVDKFYFIV